MRSLLFVLLCLTACSTSSEPKPGASGPLEQLAPAPKPAQLDGIGQCVGPRCTLHFAVQATGDVDTFTTARCSKPECRSWRGKVTPSAHAKMSELAGRLIKEQFEPVYGCPGCADGPSHEVVIHHPDGRVLSHKLDPLKDDQAPALLVEASQLIGAIKGAIKRCEANDLFVPAADCKEIMAVETQRPSGLP